MLPGLIIVTKSAAMDYALCEKYMGSITFPIPLFPNDTEVMTRKVVIPTNNETATQPLVSIFANNLYELAKYYDKIMSYWENYKLANPHIIIASYNLDETQVARLDIKFEKFYSLATENGNKYNLPTLKNFWKTVGKDLSESAEEIAVNQKSATSTPNYPM